MKIICLYLLYNKVYIIPYIRKSYPNRYYINNYTMSIISWNSHLAKSLWSQIPSQNFFFRSLSNYLRENYLFFLLRVP